VQASAVARSPRRFFAASTGRPVGRGPLLALIGGALLLVLGAALVVVHVTAIALDESLIQQSAVHYTSNLPHSLLHDADARATNRLYSLVLSIPYHFTGGPSAVRIDRVLSVLMFVSAVFPIFLMARVILPSAFSAVLVALLSVATPWLTLTSALFTENLSYPLFWWALLAICAAVWSPSLRADLLALIAIGLLVGTRVQFVAIFVAYLICVLCIGVWRADGSRGTLRRLAGALRELPRRFPATAALLGLVLAGLVYTRLSGGWHAHVKHLLGSYSNVVIRSGLPPNMAEGVLIEVLALSLGVGLLPALVAFPWYASKLSRPRLERRWVHLAVVVLVTVVFLALTVYSQGGFLGGVTEERYFFYVIPVLWLGAFAAVSEGALRVGPMLGCTVALAALYGVLGFDSPLTEETAFLAPVESIVPRFLSQEIVNLHLTGLTVGDALTVLVLLAGFMTAIVWARRPRRRAAWTLGAAALLQLLIAGYAFAAIDGQVAGVQGRTDGSTSALGWVDDHASGRTVTWLQNMTIAAPMAVQVPAAGAAASQTHVTLFWNSQLRNWMQVPVLGLAPVEFPLSSLPGAAGMTVAAGSGALGPVAIASGVQEIVGESNSPFLQVAGSTLARSPDGFLTLTGVTQPLRASWLAKGLQADGYVVAGSPVRTSAFQASSATPMTLTVTYTFSPPPPLSPASPSHVVLDVHLAKAHRLLALASGEPQRSVRLSTCLAPGAQLASGTIGATRTVPLESRSVGGVLVAVLVSSAPAKRC
jgi:hypothetical protein